MTWKTFEDFVYDNTKVFKILMKTNLDEWMSAELQPTELGKVYLQTHNWNGSPNESGSSSISSKNNTDWAKKKKGTPYEGKTRIIDPM